jgi:ribosomal protein S27E
MTIFSHESTTLKLVCGRIIALPNPLVQPKGLEKLRIEEIISR